MAQDTQIYNIFTRTIFCNKRLTTLLNNSRLKSNCARQ